LLEHFSVPFCHVPLPYNTQINDDDSAPFVTTRYDRRQIWHPYRAV